MDESRIKYQADDVPVVAVGVGRTRHGNTHTGVAHRKGQGPVYFFEQAWDQDTRNRPVGNSMGECNGRFVFVVPNVKRSRALSIAGLCRLVATVGTQFTYALRYDEEALFNIVTGALTMPNGNGLSCSTMVLVIFKSAKLPIINFLGWPTRDDDVDFQRRYVEYLAASGAPAERMEAVRQEIGCIRARPEEIGGACVCDLPARFPDAEAGARAVLRSLEPAP